MAVNGPELVHCDSIVREAMGSYWGGKMHFVRRKSNPSVKTIRVVQNCKKLKKYMFLDIFPFIWII